MMIYRVQQELYRHGVPLLPAVLRKSLQLVGGCVIGRGAEFGPRFVLVHSLGVVINGRVTGGSGVQIEHQVTIGAASHREQAPILGDDVFIGAGAKVVGGVRIGTGARIGANAVVVKDVPPYATVVGVPARVVRIRPPPTATPSARVEADAPTARPLQPS
jgi:serine O-acetyltransferase